MRDEFIDNNASDRNRLLIHSCISFYVIGKVINNSENVPATTLSEKRHVYNVHRDSLKWCSSVDQSEGNTVARVSLITIACRKVLALILNVFGNL